MNKILFESNTFWLLRDYPEEPKILTVNARVEYEKAIKACIAAKTKIDNFELIEEQVFSLPLSILGG